MPSRPAARDAVGEVLGTKGLGTLLAQNANPAPEDLVEHLAAAIHDDHEVRDDMTLLAVARTAPAKALPNA